MNTKDVKSNLAFDMSGRNDKIHKCSQGHGGLNIIAATQKAREKNQKRL